MVDQNEKITMMHGAGGAIMHDLVKNFLVKTFGAIGNAEVPLEAMDDAAVVGDIVFKSDSHAVKPIFFPGGDIGRIAISGTVNDISCLGAQPFALACGLILEEGLLLSDLDRILISMHKACVEADVGIVTGDTKVVEKGALGGLVMNVSGIGKRTSALDKNLAVVRSIRELKANWTLDSNLIEGEKIILTGTLGEHGLAVLSAQQGLKFGSEIKSDVKPLNHMVQELLGQVGGVVAIKDPTRGGLADALHEWTEKSKIGILLQEEKIPIRQDVQIACEMLGIDPLEIGNEGKLIIGVVPQKAQEVLEFLHQTVQGKDAQIIGETTAQFGGVAMQTAVGGKRIVARPVGDPIPRIC
ncbi:MAG: hydrogenase expression/formation protein HypE [Nitrososphaerota archaeon]|jgi:hydrogenase expression/formation protein HypE|nr:hydrogenase expression/formation protein HypE [Nitrososphaerota archaeon]